MHFTALCTQAIGSGIVPVGEESEQGKAKSSAGMKRKGTDVKALI